MNIFCQRRRCTNVINLLMISVAVIIGLCTAQILPRGVTLEEGVTLPKDFKWPEGIPIPSEGIVITQEMID